MRSNLRARLLIALAFAFGATVGSIPAGATAFSIDQSDLWWNPDESGWGVQFVQTGSAVVATMYVFRPSGEPIWYIAALEAEQTPNTWSGDLYVGTGPWFGTTPFNPAAVVGRKVGTMTWVALSVESGTLTYAVDGVAVSKAIHRQTLRFDDYAGEYFGIVKMTSCDPLSNGQISGFPAVFTVTHGVNQLVVKTQMFSSVNVGPTVCTFAGDRAQSGHYGKSRGTFTCEDGSSGTHVFTEMTVQKGRWDRLWSGFLDARHSSDCMISAHLFGTGTVWPMANQAP